MVCGGEEEAFVRVEKVAWTVDDGEVDLLGLWVELALVVWPAIEGGESV